MCLSFPWNGTAQCKINDLSHDLWIAISCHHLLQMLWCTVSCSCFLCLHLQLGDSEDLIPTPGALEPTCRSQTSTIPTVWRVSSPAKMASETKVGALHLSEPLYSLSHMTKQGHIMAHPLLTLLHPWLVLGNDFQLASIHKKKTRPHGHSGFKTLRSNAHTGCDLSVYHAPWVAVSVMRRW